ncbi:hypothetical protein EJ05DRAFT_422085, partial [Pseudovirgaria hyperparasitica]
GGIELNPGKKRKLGDASSKSSTPRAKSPPWKKFVAEGPTTIFEGGKRKSSRVNVVTSPVQSQPESEQKRVMRPQTGKSTYTLPSVSNSPKPKDKDASFGLASTPVVKRGPGRPRKSSYLQSQMPPPPAPGSSPPNPDTNKRAPPAGRRRRDTWVYTLEPPKKGSLETVEILQSRRRPKPEVITSDTPEPTAQVDQEVSPSQPKLKLKLRRLPPRPPRLQHPGQIPKPRKFESFEHWYNVQDPFEGEEEKRTTDSDTRRRARIVMRILDAAEPGGPLSENKCSRFQPEPVKEPPPQYGTWEFVVAHAINFQSLLQKEKTKHRQWAKRYAQDVVAELSKRRGGHEPTLEELVTARKKQLMHDLKAMWKLAQGDTDKLRKARWEEEQHELGKQALDEMLDQSKELLNRRQVSSEPESDEEDDQEDRGSANGKDDGEITDADSDAELSKEQLEEKYKHVISMSATQSEFDHNDDSDDGDSVDESGAEDEQSDDDDGSNSGDKDKHEDDGDFADDMDVDTSQLLADPNGDNDNDAMDIAPADTKSWKSIDLTSDTPYQSRDADNTTAPPQKRAPMDTSKGDADLTPEELRAKYRNIMAMSMEDVFAEAGLSDQEDASGSDDDSGSSTEESSDEENESDVEDEGDQENEAEPTPLLGFYMSKTELQSAEDTPEATTPSHTPQSMDEHDIHTPSLLRGKLRPYQHDGLDWLAEKWRNGTNGILADEMGLGKTIQTIALLAHCAERGEWGPHLIVVPTSVMLNWEMEFKKFCPGFKILTYYGTQEERKNKRRGWYNSHLHQVGNVVITSYQLILQDELAFKKRDWYYLVLDEAHNIKNFQSQRWQALLKFKTQRRLLLTGTPLQNSIQELWALLYFLMPAGDDGQGGFANLGNFTQALKQPTNQILEQGREVLDADAQSKVTQLHTVLRPYLLRRMKAEVEKQMPGKSEEVIFCSLSKRQRQLYDGFMGRSDTKQTLSSGNYMSIMNCLMSLRKVCNHPDLFETRSIVTSFTMRKPVAAEYEIKDLLFRRKLLKDREDETVNLEFLNLRFTSYEPQTKYDVFRAQQLRTHHVFDDLIALQTKRLKHSPVLDGSIDSGLSHVAANAEQDCLDKLRSNLTLSHQRSAMVRTYRGLEFMSLPLYGSDTVKFLYLDLPNRLAPPKPKKRKMTSDWYLNTSSAIHDLLPTLEQRAQAMEPYVQKFGCITPSVVADGLAELSLSPEGVTAVRTSFPPDRDPFHKARIRLSIAFPDKRLLQFDCGKLQKLALLLRELTSQGHRALIFTQMTKVLDILEEFLNVHGYKYFRLDGSTPIEKRQVYTSQFNQDTRIPVFILSSRSGGLGLNLTGADTVIFYDLDWNPAMDKQCQDRAHRIGQTRDVRIYRMVSEYTIEMNILRKSNQKRLLDDVIIQQGDFTTDHLKDFKDVKVKEDLQKAEQLGELDIDASAAMDRVLGNLTGVGKALEQVEDVEDVRALENARKEEVEEVREDLADFDETKTKEMLETKGNSKLQPDEEKRHVDEYMV